jgi:hypothetical protein
LLVGEHQPAISVSKAGAWKPLTITHKGDEYLEASPYRM